MGPRRLNREYKGHSQHDEPPGVLTAEPGCLLCPGLTPTPLLNCSASSPRQAGPWE